MSEWIKELFVTIFGTNSWLATLIISMIPIVELRGAIPFGAATDFWGDNALELWESLLFSLLGSTFVCVLLTFLFWPILKWLKQTKIFKRMAVFIEKKLNRNAEGINKKTQSEKDAKRIKWLKIIAIWGFVAIPLPLTGVWTGTCLALFIGLNKKQTMATVISGNVVAGLLMTLISYFFKENTMIVFYAFFILVGIFILYEVVKTLIKKIKARKTSTNEVETKVEIKEENESVVQDEIENENAEIIEEREEFETQEEKKEDDK